MAYLIAAIEMTLSVFEGYFTIASLSNAIFGICGASRSPSASAELFVINYI